MSKWILLVIASAPLSGVLGADEAARGLKPDSVRPAMLVWDIGTNRPKGATRYVEAVTRVTDENRQLWRITHYPHDIVATHAVEFDLYDVDAATLTPVRSVTRNAALDFVIAFNGPQVSVHRKEGTTESADEIASTLAKMPTKGLAYIKKILSMSFTNTLDEQLQDEDIFQQRAAQTADYKEGVAAFMEKRDPVFRGE